MPSSYINGAINVGTTPTLIATLTHNWGIYLVNTGTTTVYFGGQNVAATGVNQGTPLAANAGIVLPSIQGAALYAVTASSTTTVAFTTPQFTTGD